MNIQQQVQLTMINRALAMGGVGTYLGINPHPKPLPLADQLDMFLMAERHTAGVFNDTLLPTDRANRSQRMADESGSNASVTDISGRFKTLHKNDRS